MDEPKLIINSDSEYDLDRDLITIGRAPDNDIAFPEDSNVSRFHAEIEKRGDDFWIIDLGSFNGTELNGEKLAAEKPLNDRDVISFGGTSRIEVLFTPLEEEPDEDDKESAEEPVRQDSSPEPEAPEPEQQQSGSKMPVLLIVAALAVGLAVIFVVAAALFYLTREDPMCAAEARIIKPERGDSLKNTTEIELEIINGDCVAKVIYTIEGKEFANATKPPFSASIEPSDFPEFEDGLNRNLGAVLFDEKGNQINQSEEVAFFVETIETSKPDDTPTTTVTTTPTTTSTGQTTKPGDKQISARDTIKMSENVVRQFSGSSSYKFNQRFLLAVRKKAPEYVSEGYFERARKYKDQINIAYIREQNLDPPLGYILAMSRSKFLPKRDSQGTGLWRMYEDFVSANAYNGMCGTETIASASQNCAAKASALYLKNLVINIFEGDVVYGVAAFGMSPQEAEAWKATLPPNRTDFWNVIKSPKQRQEVVNFFAAALVAENPQKFGLKKDRPLSEHYAIYMK